MCLYPLPEKFSNILGYMFQLPYIIFSGKTTWATAPSRAWSARGPQPLLMPRHLSGSSTSRAGRRELRAPRSLTWTRPRCSRRMCTCLSHGRRSDKQHSLTLFAFTLPNNKTSSFQIYEIQSNFNNSLVRLKEQKAALAKRYAELTTRLAVIAEDIPKNMRQSAPMAPPTMDPELEDPAANIKVVINTGITEMTRYSYSLTLKRIQSAI